uniref:CREB/ATF bZIP transcription factor n=1 Tax=Myxine glutinosa TaxID=7769 RepID=UPI003590268E
MDMFDGLLAQSPLPEDLEPPGLGPEAALDWDPGLEDGEIEACLRTFANADRLESLGLPLDVPVGDSRRFGEDCGLRPRAGAERKVGRKCHPVKEIPRSRKRLAGPASHDDEDEEAEDDEEEDDEEELEKNRKNAIAARLNRQRKKRYVEGLEVQVGDLEHEKRQLQNECERLESRVKQLEGEVVYLRSVLSNDSALAGLLNLVTRAGRTGLLKTHTSPRTNGPVAEHDYAGSNLSSILSPRCVISSLQVNRNRRLAICLPASISLDCYSRMCLLKSLPVWRGPLKKV